MSELQAELRKSSHPTHTGNVLIFLWGLWSTTNRRSCPPLFFCFLIGLDQLFSCFCCCSKKSLQHLLHDSCSHFAVSYDKLQRDLYVIYYLSCLLATQPPEKLLNTVQPQIQYHISLDKRIYKTDTSGLFWTVGAAEKTSPIAISMQLFVGKIL